MKIALLMAALLTAGTASAAETPIFTPFVGGDSTYRELPATVNGKNVTLVRIESFLHVMDLPPGGVQEFSDFVEYFVKDGTGNLSHCEKWIKQVRADERAWTKKDATYPYLEINLASNAKPMTWRNKQIYRGTDVRCWEVRDFGPPLE